MTQVFIGIGSNIERQRNVDRVLATLEKDFPGLCRSTIYESPAVGFKSDPFYNLVVGFQTLESVESLRHYFASLEKKHGRDEAQRGFRARTLDVDLLLYGELVRDDAKLRLPADDILRYEFVLRPLVDLAPNLEHPVSGKSLAWHWREMSTSAALTTRAIDEHSAWISSG